MLTSFSLINSYSHNDFTKSIEKTLICHDEDVVNRMYLFKSNFNVMLMIHMHFIICSIFKREKSIPGDQKLFIEKFLLT